MRQVEVLSSYDWPGNVRELKNVCERLAVGVEHDHIDSQDVSTIIGQNPNGECIRGGCDAEDLITVSISGGMRCIEEEIMRQVLQRVDGDRSEAARLLGVSRTTLWRRLADSQ